MHTPQTKRYTHYTPLKALVDSSENNKTLRLVGEGVEGATRKRYNVAISRAKDQLWIVHSIDKNSQLFYRVFNVLSSNRLKLKISRSIFIIF